MSNQDFDPDAFIKGFDPDEFLGKKQEEAPSPWTAPFREVYDAGKSAVSAIGEGLNPFSESRRASIERQANAPSFGAALAENIGQIGSAGRGLLGIPQLAAAPLEAVVPPIAGAYDYIHPGTYDEAKDAVRTAMLAARPKAPMLRPAPAAPLPPQTGPLGVTLSRGQATGELPLIQAEQAAVRGQTGPGAQARAKEFFDQQAAQREQAAENVARGFDPFGARVADTPQDAADLASSTFRSEAARRKAEVGSLYEEARNLPGEIDAAMFRNIGDRIKSDLSLGAEPVIIDDLTPRASRAIDYLDKQISNLRIPNKADPIGWQPGDTNHTVAGITLKGVDQWRKHLSTLRRDAFSSGNAADGRATKAVMDAFDDRIDAAIKGGLFTGDPRAIKAWSDARAAHADYKSTFSAQKKDPVGRVVEKVLGDRINDPATPNAVADHLFGSSGVNPSDLNLGVAKRFKQVLGENSPEWSAVKQGLWSRLTEPGEGIAAWGPKKTADRITKFLNVDGREMAGAVYSPQERAAMRAYAEMLRKLEVPQAGANWSNTATFVQKTLDKLSSKIGSGLSTAIGAGIGHAVGAPFIGEAIGAGIGYGTSKIGKSFANRRELKKIADQMPLVGEAFQQYQRALARHNRLHSPPTQKQLNFAAANLMRSVVPLGIDIAAEDEPPQRAAGGQVSRRADGGAPFVPLETSEGYPFLQATTNWVGEENPQVAAQAAREAAAVRQQRSVLARDEGAITKGLEHIGAIPAHMVGAMAGMVDAAKMRAAQEQGAGLTEPMELSSDFDPRRQQAELTAETALNLVGVPGLTGAVPAAALGSAAKAPLYHGSPRTNLHFLNPSERGPLGPGVYTTEAQQVAQWYAGPDGRVYELPAVERDIYRGHGHRTDDEWFGFKADKERLLAAAEPEKREALGAILDRMWSGDGYPAFARISQLYGGDVPAQNLFRKAGFEGISGMIDGPETLLFGPRSQPIFGANSADKRAAAAIAAANQQPGIRAYHGSPHDFDRFDMSKIGTGEGAQAYGHGLYFAENPKVAQQYRDDLTRSIQVGNKKLSIGGQLVGTTGNKELDDLILTYDARGGTIDDVIGIIRNQMLDPNKRNAERYSKMLPIAEDAQRKGVRVGQLDSAGRMYEVNINAKPEQFLDHDLNLNKQTPEVKDALWRSGIYQEGPYRSGALTYQDLSDRGTVGQGLGLRQAQASELLREAGIPGIKYLDQGSRRPGSSSLTPAQLDARIESLRADIATGGGNQEKMRSQLAGLEREREAWRNLTHNYVVFDDSIITILRKYGFAGLSMLPPATAEFIKGMVDRGEPLPLQRAAGGRVEPANIERNPTEAQKEAGNYAKDHVRVHGLDITIENAKGQMRRGVGRDGKPWAVRMPASYGYLKRTEGADGDHVDVYLGPHLKSNKVFIVDQIDAETKKFDEHKVCIGFASLQQVVDTYCKGFSDGKGASRCGHVTPCTIDEFKAWLKRGDTTKQVNAKSSHAEAGYVRASTHPGERCARCTMFIPKQNGGPSCVAVVSPIHPLGWCRFFERRK